MDSRDFLEQLAKQLANDLKGNDQIRGFTTNSDLIGAYAEATVRSLVVRCVSPLLVSRGAIVYEGNCPNSVMELDTIIWQPRPVPAVFEVGDFAIVPRASAVAFLEVKRSAYGGCGTSMKDRLDQVDELVPLFGEYVTPEHYEYLQARAFGVVCLRKANQHDSALDDLVAGKKAVVLLREKDGVIDPDARAVYNLINFLTKVRLRAAILDGMFVVRTDSLNDERAGSTPRCSD